MKLTPKKLTVLLVLLALVLAAVGATYAYLMSIAPPIENEFEPVFVSCEIEENGSRVTAKNTGDITAYLRATVIVSWVSTKNGNLYPATPQESIDYTLSLTAYDWAKGSDGYYYYTMPLASGASTSELYSALTELTEAPEGYELRVTVLASAVQAEPTTAVTTFWGVSVLDNGNLSVE